MATAGSPADLAGSVLQGDGGGGADAADQLFLLKKPDQAIALFPIVLLLYVPISYYTDQWLYKRRQRNKAQRRGEKKAARRDERLDVRAFTVGPVQENAYIVRAAPGHARA